MDALAIIVSVVGTSVGATWVIRSKLGDLERAIATHMADDANKFAVLTARVIRLEKRRGYK